MPVIGVCSDTGGVRMGLHWSGRHRLWFRGKCSSRPICFDNANVQYAEPMGITSITPFLLHLSNNRQSDLSTPILRAGVQGGGDHVFWALGDPNLCYTLGQLCCSRASISCDV